MINTPNSIVSLWSAGCLPIKDGLYRADGLSREVVAEPQQPSGLKFLESFSLAAFIAADPEYVSQVDVTLERELQDHSGYLFCGEGSYGSEGFFGRLDVGRRLVWVVYLEESNPFINVIVNSSNATFRSSSGLTVKVDLNGANFGP